MNTGTLIYQFNGITVHLYAGVYSITDGRETVAVPEGADILYPDVLKDLIEKKSGVKQLASAAASNRKANSLGSGYFEPGYEIGSGSRNDAFSNWFSRQAELQEAAEMGY
jgi:hypothetical protein